MSSSTYYSDTVYNTSLMIVIFVRNCSFIRSLLFFDCMLYVLVMSPTVLRFCTVVIRLFFLFLTIRFGLLFLPRGAVLPS